MNKRIFSIIMAAVMVCSVICAAVPEKASATSKKPYMTTGADYYTGTPREKVGDYYIWVERSYENNFYSLKCAKSLKKGKEKTLKKLNSKTKELGWDVVTDGNTIYYSVYDWKAGKSTIYKTTVKGSKHKKVKAVSHVVAFYGGKIYYNAAGEDHDDPPIYLYSYDIAKKKTRLEKKDYEVYSAYGRYMIGGQPQYGGAFNVMLKLYDAKTGKSRSVTKGREGGAVISGKTIYYETVTFNSSDYSTTYTLKKCGLSGKNKKTIKKIPENMSVYIGRKAAYFYDSNTGKTKKLTYSTKKFTTVK